MGLRIKKGDRVRVISGKDSGKEGNVLKVLPKMGRVLVEGVNLRKKHQRPRARGQKGEIITMPHPLHISNVMFMCPSCRKPTRVGMRLGHEVERLKKERLCKKCAAPIP